jgi:hypothetical protein
MKMKLFAVVAGLFLVSGVLWAHHAGSIYDRDNPVTFKGVVTEFQFTNPHVQVVFEVKNAAGQTEIWKAGSAPPQRLYRAGWNTKTLQPGDEITVTCAPAKDGSKVCSIRNLTGPGGKVLTQGAE